MKQIRLNVFETNSSSSHSLVFGGVSDYLRWLKTVGDTKFDEKIDIDSSMGFGWEIESYTSSNNLASYLWIWLVGYRLNFSYVESLHEEPLVISFFNGINRRTIHPISFDDVVDTYRKNYEIDGYIDHQSNDLIDKELELWQSSFDDFVEYFVWSGEVILRTDNDNHSYDGYYDE
jgi:hypothetical protein